MFKLDDGLVQEYLDEAAEQLSAMEMDLLAMEVQGADFDEERTDRIFRAVHSIKGGADLFDLKKIGELAHETEHVLALIRSRKIAVTPERVRVLLRVIDRLSEQIRHSETSGEADNSEWIRELARLHGDGRDSTAKSQEPEAGAADAGRVRPRMLIVEDDFTSRLLLQTFLSRYGDCHIAVNGREAVEAVRIAIAGGTPYQLICMDIMMPEMDGQEALRQIRALEEERGIVSTRGAKIIMTTALTEPKDVCRSFHELCDFYLFKPISTSRLLGHLKALQLV